MVDAKTAALYAASFFLLAIMCATPLFIYAWPDQPALILLVLLLFPGVLLFVRAMEGPLYARAAEGPHDAGAAAPCQHRWQACSDGLTGRQVARCVVCGSEVPLP